ncbi:ectonucleotide pyrophosphatase/phosphodiesterase [Granulicella cerasi]|uniref:Ectonucleotide pyrophosphatase/phosphodiesterase n=1 Tax=Granulicella cerasi TaxID=741063 RepID=A0ABW1Z6G0_9BACT|nr:ectonucleotide pyrophosphatase/phosphodiesterase [Granulicella cerasi]
MRLRSWLLSAAMASASVLFAQDITPVIHANNPPNASATLAKHYVVMVSLDGFRYDYSHLYATPHLDAMAADGASTPKGMRPSYPSITFPNHYALVTGLRPEHNGLVGMEFWDPARHERYLYSDSKTNSDGSWYRGVPLWSLAEKQGMRSACFFWPGSEAEIAGKRPSYYLHFDGKLDDDKRVEQIIAWLKLPEAERPHFLTLYYANTDDAGHHYGPESPEAKEAVEHVDALIGELREGIQSTGLPVDLIVTADHGMIKLDETPVVLDTMVDLRGARTEGPFVYPKSDAEKERIYRELKAKNDPRFSVYRRHDLPKELYYRDNDREGDPVIVPNAPYSVMWHPRKPSGHPYVGSHGFNAMATPEMKAIFYAEGPDVKPGTKIESFDNVDVYSFVAKILQLKPGKTDGELGPLKAALAKP